MEYIRNKCSLTIFNSVFDHLFVGIPQSLTPLLPRLFGGLEMKHKFVISLYVKYIVCVFLIFYGTSIAAAETVKKNIGRITYDKDKAAVYILNTDNSGWGAVNCESARYVLFNTNAAESLGGKEMLSLVLVAKSTGKLISFGGACDASSETIFNANSFTIYD